MDDTPHSPDPPPDWIKTLAESDDDLAAGRIVPGQHVRQGLLDSIARIEARHADDIQDPQGIRILNILDERLSARPARRESIRHPVRLT